ncbi:hypothetical protein [Clostridium sp. C8-1-8]|nr:hypothetical protein [Clostridium sp. C8-1-8]
MSKDKEINEIIITISEVILDYISNSKRKVSTSNTLETKILK